MGHKDRMLNHSLCCTFHFTLAKVRTLKHEGKVTLHVHQNDQYLKRFLGLIIYFPPSLKTKEIINGNKM